MDGKFTCEVYVECEDAEDAAFLSENFKKAFESRVIGTIPGGVVRRAAVVGELEAIGPEQN